MTSHSKEQELSGLQLDHHKLLVSCCAIMEGVQQDAERLRSKLATIPWDVLDNAGQGRLENARMSLAQVEGHLVEAQKLLEFQRSRVAKK